MNLLEADVAIEIRTRDLADDQRAAIVQALACSRLDLRRWARERQPCECSPSPPPSSSASSPSSRVYRSLPDALFRHRQQARDIALRGVVAAYQHLKIARVVDQVTSSGWSDWASARPSTVRMNRSFWATMTSSPDR